jgi:hypothetical protein
MRILTASRIARAALLTTSTALWSPSASWAQNASVHPEPPPSVRAVPSRSQIVLDGRLDEAAWLEAPPATDFRQSQPNEGRPATQRTEVRILYDDAAIYVGARMFDEQGGAGVRSRLARRDNETDSDLLTIVFDTFHDHLGRTQFTVNPSGVKGDAYGPGNTGVDDSWDPVWDVATRIDSLGWSAEMRIPLSQLRFPRDTAQTWGMQIVRLASRINERSHWAWWPNNAVGGPQRYGHLEGLVIHAHPQRLELMPYVVGRSANVQVADPADPFAKAHDLDSRVGGDLRYLLTSNLTLSATFNPDFGQVEVDPAVVNLSAFETFFPERRPFFIEGRGMFGFGGFSCYFCSNVSSLSTFFSRRIGRQPQGAGIAQSLGPYSHVPDNTTILGAAKITGRTGAGYSVGIMDAVTRREHARVALVGGGERQVEVEPLTNYFVARVKRDLRGGNLVLGGIATSVCRSLGDSALATLLTRHSELAGFDIDWSWAHRTYNVMMSTAISQIVGDSAAILRIQRSSARYFQRPDRAERGDGLFGATYNPAATSLRGYGLYARVAKEGGNWLWEAQTNIRSPGFENNDIAFLQRTDYRWMAANIFRNNTRLTRWYRSSGFIIGGQQQYNFDGDLTDRQWQVYGYLTPLNYWNTSAFYIHRPPVFDDRLTRSGPVVKRAGLDFYQVSVSTDSRRRLVLGTNPSISHSSEGAHSWSANLDVRVRPAPSVSLSLGPFIDYSEARAQYVTAVSDPTATAFGGVRYVFASLTQRTVGMDVRLNVTFSTRLTLELFAQPFLAGGQYFDFKEFAAPRGLRKNVYGRDIGTATVQGAGAGRTTAIDPDGPGPAASFTLGNPDFTFRSLRGNAVLRWEWRPGSTLFVVWQQSRSDVGPEGDLDFGRDSRQLFRSRPDNIFLVKVSYWLNY